jgi:hypothetical protein
VLSLLTASQHMHARTPNYGEGQYTAIGWCQRVCRGRIWRAENTKRVSRHQAVQTQSYGNDLADLSALAVPSH